MGYDVDTVYGEILGNISDAYQKTVGFPTYDLTRTFALAIKSLGDDLLTAETAVDVGNMTGDTLTKWCFQHKGVVRKAATYAAWTITIVTFTGEIIKGSLFESGGVQFAATEKKSVTDGDTVSVQAVTAGVQECCGGGRHKDARHADRNFYCDERSGHDGRLRRRDGRQFADAVLCGGTGVY